MINIAANAYQPPGTINRPFFSGIPQPDISKVGVYPGVPESMYLRPGAPAAYRKFMPRVQYVDLPIGYIKDPTRDPAVRRRTIRRNLPANVYKALTKLDQLKEELKNIGSPSYARSRVLVRQQLIKALKGMPELDENVKWKNMAKSLEEGRYEDFSKEINEAIRTPGVSKEDLVVLEEVAKDSVNVGFIPALPTGTMKTFDVLGAEGAVSQETPGTPPGRPVGAKEYEKEEDDEIITAEDMDKGKSVDMPTQRQEVSTPEPVSREESEVSEPMMPGPDPDRKGEEVRYLLQQDKDTEMGGSIVAYLKTGDPDRPAKAIPFELYKELDVVKPPFTRTKVRKLMEERKLDIMGRPGDRELYEAIREKVFVS
jgi:hypothetical protein